MSPQLCLQELQTQLTEQASLVKQERKRREAAERQQKKAQEEKVGDPSRQLFICQMSK